MDTRGSSHVAPYGQACVQCFKAKCKCIRRPHLEACERCHRLNKECHPSDSFRKRNSQNTQSSTTRIAQLEAKVDGLVSLLQNVARKPDAAASLSQALNDQGIDGDESMSRQDTSDCFIPTPASSSITIPASVPTTGTSENSATIPARARPTSARTTRTERVDGSSNPVQAPVELSADEAESCLAIFRTQMLRYFAFFHLPPNLTAQQLRQDRPFLFRAIVTVVSSSNHEKRVRAKELKRILAQAMVMENQSSLDLLLGLMTYISWGNDQFLFKSHTLSRLAQMAVSILYDLRLNKPPWQNQPGLPVIGFNNSNDSAEERSGESDGYPLERQRAVLGCFIISSTVSFHFGQIDTMRWTPEMVRCLNELDAKRACPTDEALVLQARLQLLALKAIQARDQQELETAMSAPSPALHSTTTSANGATVPALTMMQARAIASQLQELRASLPPELHGAFRELAVSGADLRALEFLISHVHFVELVIYDTSYTSCNDPPFGCIPVTGPLGVERLEGMWRSLTAIKSWMDVVLGWPASSYQTLSFITGLQLMRCIKTLYRLSNLVDPSWDLQAVRSTVDLVWVLDRVLDNVDQARCLTNEALDEDDPFSQIARILRRLRAFAVTRMAPPPLPPQQPPAWGLVDHRSGATGMGETMVADQDQMMMAQSLDFGDDLFLDDYFLSGL